MLIDEALEEEPDVVQLLEPECDLDELPLEILEIDRPIFVLLHLLPLLGIILLLCVEPLLQDVREIYQPLQAVLEGRYLFYVGPNVLLKVVLPIDQILRLLIELLLHL